jgi:adenylate cyclase class 2
MARHAKIEEQPHVASQEVVMLEIEMKFPVADFQAVQARLQEWHAHAEPTLEEADQYFNAPDRDFGETDEAFRLRHVGTINRITYKGPRAAGPTKTRTEIEVDLEGGGDAYDKFCALVKHLGYRAVAVVRKRRTCYDVLREGWDLQVSCDEVEEVGRFVEVEIVAAEDQKTEAQAVLQRVAAELGLSTSERRSYLEMLLTKRG